MFLTETDRIVLNSQVTESLSGPPDRHSNWQTLKIMNVFSYLVQQSATEQLRPQNVDSRVRTQLLSTK